MFTRVDLVRHSARSLTVTTVRQRDRQLDESVGRLLTDNQHFVSGAIYRRSRTRHILTATASVFDPQQPVIGMAVFIDASADAQLVTSVPKEYSREQEFLRAVEALDGPFQFEARVEFSFDYATDGNLWFPLPTRLPGWEGVDGEMEIRGVSGLKLAPVADALPEFRFDLTRWSEEAMLTISFSLSSDRFSSEIPRTVLDYGVEASEMLVRGK